MKKILIIALVLLMASPAYAFNFGTGNSRIKVFEAKNTTAVGSIVSVPTTLIKPGSRILGVVVTKAADGGSGNTGLYDTIKEPGGFTVSEAIGEVETTDGNNGNMWFPYALTVVTSIEIRQGENTVVYIYYE